MNDYVNTALMQMANASSATCWLHPYAHVPNNSHDTVFQTSTTAIHQSTWFYVEWHSQMTRETLQMRITCSTHFRDQASFLIQPSHNNIDYFCSNLKQHFMSTGVTADGLFSLNYMSVTDNYTTDRWLEWHLLSLYCETHVIFTLWRMNTYQFHM